MLAADFSFQDLNALFVLVKFTQSLLVHTVDLTQHVFICLLLNMVMMHVMMLAHNVIESIEIGILFGLNHLGLYSFLAARAHADLQRPLPSVLPWVGYLSPLQLLEDVLHLPLDDGVLFTGLHQELLCLKFQAVHFSEVLGSLSLLDMGEIKV